MHTLARPERRWYEWGLLVLKIGVVAVVPSLVLYEGALSRPGLLWPNTVNELMKRYEAPAAVGCLVAGLVLVVAGLVEWRRRRRKQAAWDFGFAVVALHNAFMLYVSLGVKVK
jgi:hypothetical protein